MQPWTKMATVCQMTSVTLSYWTNSSLFMQIHWILFEVVHFDDESLLIKVIAWCQQATRTSLIAEIAMTIWHPNKLLNSIELVGHNKWRLGECQCAEHITPVWDTWLSLIMIKTNLTVYVQQLLTGIMLFVSCLMIISRQNSWHQQKHVNS